MGPQFLLNSARGCPPGLVRKRVLRSEGHAVEDAETLACEGDGALCVEARWAVVVSAKAELQYDLRGAGCWALGGVCLSLEVVPDMDGAPQLTAYAGTANIMCFY